MVSGAEMTSYANLGNIQVRDRRFYFGVKAASRWPYIVRKHALRARVLK